MHKIEWDGDAKPEFNDLIQSEISKLLERGLARASDLFFHSIWIDDKPEGRTILVSGKAGDETETYYVEYIEKPEITEVHEVRSR